MKYLAAYLLANLSEKGATADSIKKILTAAGVEPNAEKITTVIEALKGKDLAEVIATGNSKLASVPSGGAVSGGAKGASAPGASATKEVEPEAEKEESDDDMGFGLFD
jgi:large subunit ribosomal protein LP2